MFCTNCGKELPENAGVCPSCGAPVQQYDAAPAQQTNATPMQQANTTSGEQPYNQSYSQQQPYTQPYAQQAYTQQPYAGQPYAGQPYGQQPYTQQSYAGQPYAQQPYTQQPQQYGQPYNQTYQGYNQPYQPQPAPQKLPLNKLGIAGLAVGVASLILGGYTFCIACIVGLILSAVAYAKRSTHSLNGFALGGLITSCVSFVIWFIVWCILGTALIGLSNVAFF